MAFAVDLSNVLKRYPKVTLPQKNDSISGFGSVAGEFARLSAQAKGVIPQSFLYCMS